MRSLSRKQIILLIVSIFILIALPVTIFLAQRQQDIRQRAASTADLTVTEFRLTDAGGNVRTTFNVNEDIYIRVKIKNQGGSTGISTDSYTYSEIYSHKTNTVPVGTQSDINIGMKNGQFGAGTEYLYSSIYGSSSQNKFNRNKAWKKSTAGTYTARIFINYNNFVEEADVNNNQATITYTVTSTPTYLQGSIYSSPPAGFESPYCYQNAKLIAGLDGCVMDKSTNGITYGKITNSGTTTRNVGMAGYKAYLPYPNPYPSCTPDACPEQFNWIWTQSIHSGVITSLAPGQTKYFSLQVPSCAWQTDVFEAPIMSSFLPPTSYYSGQKKYIDGFYQTALSMCTSNIPPLPTATPLPTSAPTSAPTSTPSPLPTLTPTSLPTATPSPSPTPTRTPTPLPTNTPTPIPTNTPIPTATPAPQATRFSVTAFMHGIGNSGDNSNPTQHSLSNKNPVRVNRSVELELHNASGVMVKKITGTLAYNSTEGNFTGTIDGGTDIASGNYTMKAKSPQYLRKNFTGILNITSGQTHQLPVITFVTGDINNDNSLSILDYNILIGCYSDFSPPKSCTPEQKLAADLTDDGNVNQFDYNLFLRDYSTQSGD